MLVVNCATELEGFPGEGRCACAAEAMGNGGGPAASADPGCTCRLLMPRLAVLCTSHSALWCLPQSTSKTPAPCCCRAPVWTPTSTKTLGPLLRCAPGCVLRHRRSCRRAAPRSPASAPPSTSAPCSETPQQEDIMAQRKAHEGLCSVSRHQRVSPSYSSPHARSYDHQVMMTECHLMHCNMVERTGSERHRSGLGSGRSARRTAP